MSLTSLRTTPQNLSCQYDFRRGLEKGGDTPNENQLIDASGVNLISQTQCNHLRGYRTSSAIMIRQRRSVNSKQLNKSALSFYFRTVSKDSARPLVRAIGFNWYPSRASFNVTVVAPITHPTHPQRHADCSHLTRGKCVARNVARDRRRLCAVHGFCDNRVNTVTAPVHRGR